MAISDIIKNTCCGFVKNPKREISYAWLISLGLVFIAFIVACIAANKMVSEGASDQAGSFSAIWTSLILFVISTIGTLIMRRYQTPIAIGLLLGIIFILTQQMLIIFAFFVELSQDPSNSDSLRMTQEAMAVFAFFLFFIYSVFGSLLSIFKNDIIKEETQFHDPNAFDNIHENEENFDNGY